MFSNLAITNNNNTTTTPTHNQQQHQEQEISSPYHNMNINAILGTQVPSENAFEKNNNNNITNINTNNANDDCSCCKLTNEFLSKRLEESKFGKDVLIFNNYFVADVTPAICVCCNRLIAEHQSEEKMMNAAASSHASSTNHYSIPMTMIDNNETAHNLFTKYLTKGLNVDTFKSNPTSFVWIISGVFILIAAIILISFGFTGILSRAPITCLGPCILIACGIFFSVLPKEIRVDFDKVLKVASFSSYRFPASCCGCDDEVVEVPFSDIIGIRIEETNYNVNHIPYARINLVYKTSSSSNNKNNNNCEVPNYSSCEMKTVDVEEEKKLELCMCSIFTTQSVTNYFIRYFVEIGINIQS